MRCAHRVSNGPDHLGLCARQAGGYRAEDESPGAVIMKVAGGETLPSAALPCLSSRCFNTDGEEGVSTMTISPTATLKERDDGGDPAIGTDWLVGLGESRPTAATPTAPRASNGPDHLESWLTAAIIPY